VPPVQFQNKGSFSFRGFEAALEMRNGPWRGNVAYTLTDYGVNTRARAGSKLNLSAGATVAKLDLDLTLQHVARYYAADSAQAPIPSYATVDARAGWQALGWFSVFAAAENLLDARYDTFADLPGVQAGLYRMPGRSFTLGLNLRRQ
jgi:outer membrane receptor protein involved in Fe transport